MNIFHVNHSSIICEVDNSLLLTDPWIFSNAFEFWSQSPGPNIDIIKKVFGSNNKLSIVVLSHAHDDHVDDIFLSHCQKEVKVVIPKTKNKAFKKRILRNGINNKNIIEVDEKGLNINNFFISSFSCGSLTEEDFIILISNEKELIIHANDNWHEFTSKTIEYINNIKKLKNLSEIFLMSQIGIADAYPLFYAGISSDEKEQIIREKITTMCHALIKNCKKLGINIGYAYANQSKFANLSLFRDINFDPYLIKEEIIHKFDHSIKQLMPSDKIIKGQLLRNRNFNQNILHHRLQNLENAYNAYSSAKYQNTLQVKFKILENKKNSKNNSEIILYANETVWNNILNGISNLETIITGGAGLIDKPENYNMKKEYLLLSKWAYINQKNSKENLNFF